MEITPNQRFLDGRDEYLPDKPYNVTPEKGYYFCANGWASSPDYTAPQDEYVEPEEVDLEIDNASLSTKTYLDG